MMKKIIILSIISSLFIVFSCNQKTNTKQLDSNNTSSYSDSINTLSLQKRIVNIYPSGQEKAILFFIKNQDSSLFVKEIHFYENGQKQVEGTLKNKQRNGLWIFWYDNGQIWSRGNFINGKSEGIFSIYNKDGSLKIQSYYKNGKKVKESYYKDNQCIETVQL